MKDVPPTEPCICETDGTVAFRFLGGELSECVFGKIVLWNPCPLHGGIEPLVSLEEAGDRKVLSWYPELEDAYYEPPSAPRESYPYLSDKIRNKKFGFTKYVLPKLTNSNPFTTPGPHHDHVHMELGMYNQRQMA
jgi:hypothetical protein